MKTHGSEIEAKLHEKTSQHWKDLMDYVDKKTEFKDEELYPLDQLDKKTDLRRQIKDL